VDNVLSFILPYYSPFNRIGVNEIGIIHLYSVSCKFILESLSLWKRFEGRSFLLFKRFYRETFI